MEIPTPSDNVEDLLDYDEGYDEGAQIITETELINNMLVNDLITYFETAAEPAPHSITQIYDAVIRYFEDNTIDYDMERVLQCGRTLCESLNVAAQPVIPISRPVAHLKVYVEPTAAPEGFADLMREWVNKHNTNVLCDPHPNSGFDLYVPQYTVIPAGRTEFVNHAIKCSMTFNGYGAGFYLYPRSSISKTPMFLHNGAGIIDEGYRGCIIAALRAQDTDGVLDCGARIVQICHPSLCPIYVQIVDTLEELSATTRGEGGFGSSN